MSNETGYSKETIERLLDRFTNVHHVIDYSDETKELLLLKWAKNNWTKSEKFLVGVERELKKVKNEKFKAFLGDLLVDVDTVYIGYQYPMDTSDTVTVTDTDKDKKKSIEKKHPSVDEVRAYCQERHNNVDPETFVDFYSSKGWKVGNQPMKDWKACVRTWEKRDGPVKTKVHNFNERKIDYSELQNMVGGKL
mgnify:CR=1 FL=1